MSIGLVIGLIYDYILLLGPLVYSCSKAEYTGLMNLWTVSVPYVWQHRFG